MRVEKAVAQEIEAAAVAMARGAGALLKSHFGQAISVEFKDKQQRDPVTAADKATQAYLEQEIRRQFPEHGILGEEDATESEEPARDYLWVLDPLDGTTNFLNGLPVYACSIGVLWRGQPLAAALWVPWPGESGGYVLHAHRGGGCYVDDNPVKVAASSEIIANRLVGWPGSFTSYTRLTGELKKRHGEPRTTGSIAYELALTATGVMQYAVFGAPRLWDMAGGAIAALEAGGVVMIRHPREKQWRPLDSFIPSWEQKPPTMKELRRWVAPLVVANPKVAPLVAANIHPRFSLARAARRIFRRKRR